MDKFFTVFWIVLIVAFLVGDAFASFSGHEQWTLTHFLAVRIPLSIRVALLAWLVYHFLFQHPKG